MTTPSPLPPQPTAIATLITSNEFLPGAQTVLYSIKKTLAKQSSLKSYYPPKLIVLATPQISTETREALKLFCTRVIEIEPIPGPPTKKSHVEGWVDVGYTKLRLWDLCVYEKIVYVDADCVVVKDIGHLLHDKRVCGDKDWNGLSAAPDIFPPDKFNGGFLVVKPNQTTFKKMLSQMNTLPSYDSGDTGFLNAFFPDWFDAFPPSSRLSFGYNAQRTLHHFTHKKQPGYWDSIESRLRVVHYCSSPKPWEGSRGGGELEDLWWRTYEDSKKEVDKIKSKGKSQNVNSAVLAAAANSKRARGHAAAPAAASRAPSKIDMQRMVTKSYKKFRKEGMDPKTAMARAREETGHVDSDKGPSPGMQVASMFGLS